MSLSGTAVTVCAPAPPDVRDHLDATFDAWILRLTGKGIPDDWAITPAAMLTIGEAITNALLLEGDE